MSARNPSVCLTNCAGSGGGILVFCFHNMKNWVMVLVEQIDLYLSVSSPCSRPSHTFIYTIEVGRPFTDLEQETKIEFLTNFVKAQVPSLELMTLLRTQTAGIPIQNNLQRPLLEQGTKLETLSENVEFQIETLMKIFVILEPD